MMARLIRFLSDWRGYERGRVDSDLDFGIKEALVQRGVAEWFVYNEPQNATGQTQQPRKSRR